MWEMNDAIWCLGWNLEKEGMGWFLLGDGDGWGSAVDIVL